MDFDLPSFLNIVIGAVLGALASWLVSHWYWRKSAPVERILKEVKRVLPYYFHPIRYPQFYSHESQTLRPEQPPPNDTDVPHVVEAVFTHRRILDGDDVEVQLKIRDTGRNFENPEGLAVRDHMDRPLAPRFNGLGYASVSFTATLKTPEHQNRLTITLRDNEQKANTQSVLFNITAR